MNEKYSALLQDTLIKSLAKDINERRTEAGKKPIEATAIEVFANLPEIYETATETAFGAPTGRSYRYMPKRQKAMVMRLVAPEHYAQVKIAHQDTGVCAEAWIYLSHEDSKPVAYGKQYLSYDLAQNDGGFATDSDLHAYVESTVRGIALSKAYQEYGIGSWYSYQFDADENPDEILSALTTSDGVNPLKVYDNTTSHNTETEKNIIDSTVDVSPASDARKLDDTGNNPPETPEKTTAKKKNIPKKAKKESIPLDEARAMQAPIGKAASMNLTLGETEEKYPGNILWMYTQSNAIPPETRAALSVIILNNPDIIELFKQKGIDIPA